MMRDRQSIPAGVAAIVAALVLLSAFGPVAAIPQPDGTVGLVQNPTTVTVDPGDTIEFEATINATGYNAPAMAVDLPDGWSVEDQSADGPATYKDSTNEWLWMAGGEYTVTFTVQVPTDADSGEYTVANDGSGVDPSDNSFVFNDTATTVSVEADEAAGGGGTGGADESSATATAVAPQIVTATPTPTPGTDTPTPTVTASPAGDQPSIETAPSTPAGSVSTPESTSTPTATTSGTTATDERLVIGLLIGTVVAGLVGLRLRD